MALSGAEGNSWKLLSGLTFYCRIPPPHSLQPQFPVSQTLEPVLALGDGGGGD